MDNSTGKKASKSTLPEADSLYKVYAPSARHGHRKGTTDFFAFAFRPG
jgi:hypothetical protein